MKQIQKRLAFRLRSLVLLLALLTGAIQVETAEATTMSDAGLPAATTPVLSHMASHIRTPADGERRLTRPLLRVDANLVQVPVTVLDRNGRRVQGLTRDQFRVLEDNIPQEIVSFQTEDVPISVGLVFDTSGSMRDKLRSARSALKRFLDTAGVEDEFFLLTFADRPQMEVEFTRDFESIQNALLFNGGTGSTSLIDAVYTALTQMHGARHSRKALLVISDGGDNHSRHSSGELLSLARESDVQIYVLSALGTVPIKGAAAFSEEQRGRLLLRELAAVTGGHHFLLREASDLNGVMAKISTLLRNQYLLGYQPPQSDSSGKWRKIQVRLDVPKGESRVYVHARPGYRNSDVE